MDTMTYLKEREMERLELQADYFAIMAQKKVYEAQNTLPDKLVGMARYCDLHPRWTWMESIQIDIEARWDQEFGGDITFDPDDRPMTERDL